MKLAFARSWQQSTVPQAPGSRCRTALTTAPRLTGLGPGGTRDSHPSEGAAQAAARDAVAQRGSVRRAQLTLALRAWRPAFLDYLYVAFTNDSAFSPTDAGPGVGGGVLAS